MSQDRPGGSDNVPLAHRLLERVTDSWMAQAIHVAAELRIADLLAEGPRTSEDLATATGTDALSLRRLLRALTTIDICRERDDGSFEMMPMGSLLGANAPGSLRSFTIWWGTNLWQAWGQLLYSVTTGQSARQWLAGKEGFAHLAQDPETAAVFNQALVELTRLTAESVTRTYDFSGS